MTTAVELQHVTRHFGGLTAVRDVSFRVTEGEIVGVIGPNGAGKSTLFEILSGNLRPSTGKVAFFGEDMTQRPAHVRRRLGICRTFQKIRLFASFTVRETIRLAAQEAGDPRRDADAEVELLLDGMRLRGCADLRPHSLTLADRKKVEIARAVAGRCRVLMLDEALSGLTRAEADELVGEILSLNTKQGVTILVVEHVIPVVVAMARRLVVLDHGTLI
ncbi:MAG: ATP-binding cassette domain-containing protein, partial [Acetobacteraceae bacterium]|nr:ATP-binding cassette domain-containing protein [Acetobacteraceae bacterium]